MVTVEVLEQLVHAMDEGVARLNDASAAGNREYVNRLRIFIHDVHEQLNAALREQQS